MGVISFCYFQERRKKEREAEEKRAAAKRAEEEAKRKLEEVVHFRFHPLILECRDALLNCDGWNF